MVFCATEDDETKEREYVCADAIDDVFAIGDLVEVAGF
jgi:hypothetical protein